MARKLRQHLKWILVGWVYLLTAIGCRPSDTPSTETPNDRPSPMRTAPLRVWVADNTGLADVIQRQWTAHSQTEIELQQANEDTYPQKNINADVLIFPSAWLGQMVVNRQLVPWPTFDAASTNSAVAENDNYDWADVFSELRRHELRWGNRRYGVSFGSPQLVLMLRQDLMEAWQLSPPTTWDEYHATIAKIDALLSSESTTKLGKEIVPTLEPSGRKWSSRLLIARAAAYARDPNQYSTMFKFSTMQPMIDSPPFVRALEQLVEVHAGQANEQRGLSPSEVTARFLQGQAAMAIGWPSAAHAATDVTIPKAQFSFAPLPGSSEFYRVTQQSWESRESPTSVPVLGISGRIGAIGRRVRSIDMATSFLHWLTSAGEAIRVTSRSPTTTLSRRTQTSQAAAWVEPAFASVAGQFASILSTDQQRSNALICLRIPGHDQYLKTLDKAIEQTILGTQSAKESLRSAAKSWSELTDQLGKESQRQAYLNSLGLAP